MSHKATNWAFECRNLRPSAKLVLLALADCHNPKNGCFPSHGYLAEVTCMSERSVRDQLDSLEAAKLIRRVRINSGKGRQSNRYILGFEDDETHPTAEIAAGVAQRQTTTSPTANHDTAQRQNLPPNPVRELGNEPCVSNTHTLFKEFWEIHPRTTRRDETEAAFVEAIRVGVSPRWIIHSAKRYREEQAGNKTSYIATALSWLEKSRWQDFDPPVQSNPNDRAALIEKMKASKNPAVREQAKQMEAAE